MAWSLTVRPSPAAVLATLEVLEERVLPDVARPRQQVFDEHEDVGLRGGASGVGRPRVPRARRRQFSC